MSGVSARTACYCCTNPSLARYADLVKALLPANDQCSLHTKQTQHLRERVSELLLRDTEQHPRRRRRVDERSKDVEDSSEVEGSPYRGDVCESGVVVRRKEEEERRAGQEGWQLVNGE